ncbi:hypothetical protein JOC78_001876 [Bacillus ectoiniformans]|nr:hypothetical protein [Bacillus ectoiniformans]
MYQISDNQESVHCETALYFLDPFQVKGAAKDDQNKQKKHIKGRWQEKGANPLEDRKRNTQLAANPSAGSQPGRKPVRVVFSHH